MRGSIVRRKDKYYVITELPLAEDGKRRQKWHSGYSSRREAQRALNKLLVEVQENRYVAAGPKTFAQFVREDWLPAASVRVRELTLKRYREQLERYVLPGLGDRRLDQLDPLTLTKHYAMLLRRPKVHGSGDAVTAHRPVHPRRAQAGPVGRRHLADAGAQPVRRRAAALGVSGPPAGDDDLVAGGAARVPRGHARRPRPHGLRPRCHLRPAPRRGVRAALVRPGPHAPIGNDKKSGCWRDEPDDHGVGRSRGGLTIKTHALVDGRGLPLVIAVSPSQAGDSPAAPRLLAELRVPRLGPGRARSCPTELRADKAYSSKGLRALLRARGVKGVIPEPADQQQHRKNRGANGGRPPAFDKRSYEGRNVVERAFNQLKQWRGIATRYDKHALIYRGGVVLASIVLWLKCLGNTP